MPSNSSKRPHLDGGNGFHFDEVDLRILEALLAHPDLTNKILAKKIGVDQRTVARRIKILGTSGVMKRNIEIDWVKLGFQARAYVGSTTALGERYVSKLLEILRADPRVLEAFETVGAHQYVLHILERDLPSLRESVLRDLEPLTADLDTTVVAREVKPRDQFALMRYLLETKYPRVRANPQR